MPGEPASAEEDKGRSAITTMPWWRATPRRASESAPAASLRRPTPGSRSGPRP